MYNYANLLATGRGVAEDQAQALSLYRRAAESGHAKSMNLLGRYLEDGRYCPADPVTAVEWYRRSAEGGDFRGQFSYGCVLLAEARIEEGLSWLRQALEAGNPNFLRVATDTLRHVRLPGLEPLVAAYQARTAVLETSVPS
jgi:TPR repeat protein